MFRRVARATGLQLRPDKGGELRTIPILLSHIADDSGRERFRSHQNITDRAASNPPTPGTTKIHPVWFDPLSPARYNESLTFPARLGGHPSPLSGGFDMTVSASTK